MEIWKDIKGYEGLYQISNLGNVRSVKREKLLRPFENSAGYLRVKLQSKAWFIHRLVALHFVENPCPGVYTVVNHLDCDRQNNAASNMEWTSYKGNTQYAFRLGRRKAYPVKGYNPKTTETVTFESIKESGRNGFAASSVSKCCKGRQRMHRGYVWQYAERKARNEAI